MILSCPSKSSACLDLDNLERKLKDLNKCLEEYKREQKPDKKSSTSLKKLKKPCTPDTCPSLEECLSQSKRSAFNQIKQLKQMERDLRNRELELTKKCEMLNKKIELFQKCKREKEIRDRLTETKLKLAKKQIERALCEKVSNKSLNKDDCKRKCNPKKCRKKKRDFQDKLFKIIEWSVKKRTWNKKKRKSCSKNVCWKKNADACFNPCKEPCCKKRPSFPDYFFRCICGTGSPYQCQVEKACWSPFQAAYPCKCDAVHQMMKANRVTRCSMHDNNCILNSLWQKPQLCIYDQIPGAYPPCFSARHQFKLLGQSMLLLLAALFWSPCLLCLACICQCCCCDCC